MLDLKINVSEFIRDMRAWEVNFHRVAGRRLGEAVARAYEKMVNETPQWTGTTAASWYIGFGRGVSGSVVHLTGGPHEKTIGPGTAIGLSHLDPQLTTTNLEAYRTQDIVVVNDSPNFDIAEKGPLREVNEPGGMFAAFQDDLRNIVIDISAEISV